MASAKDTDLLFTWINDKMIRDNSYHSQAIEYYEHREWFNKKLNSNTCDIYIFNDTDNMPIGYVRIEKVENVNEALIGIAIDVNKRGKGYSTEMLEVATMEFFKKNQGYQIFAYIMKKNQPSYKTFTRAGYKFLREEDYKNIPSLVLHKTSQ